MTDTDDDGPERDSDAKIWAYIGGVGAMGVVGTVLAVVLGDPGSALGPALLSGFVLGMAFREWLP